jgi:hypothetical protein
MYLTKEIKEDLRTTRRKTNTGKAEAQILYSLSELALN